MTSPNTNIDELLNKLFENGADAYSRHNAIGSLGAYNEKKQKDTAAAKTQLQALLSAAKIEELKHIDDPVNVNLYWEGLMSVEERIKELEKKK